MKKSIFLLKNLQRISRDELRKIGGGDDRCSGCSPLSNPTPDGFCVLRTPCGLACLGSVVGDQCCSLS